MPELVIELGDIGTHLPPAPWIVVFGGVTREGNRRARRAIKSALESDLSVVWFDGFSERWHDLPSSDRVPLDASVPDGKVVIIDYQNAERGHWLTRAIERPSKASVVLLANAENPSTARGGSRVSVLAPLRRRAKEALGILYKKVLRRILLVFRGVVGWRLVRDDISLLAQSLPAPRRIIYGDDFALTIGWHSARLWQETPTSMEMTEG